MAAPTCVITSVKRFTYRGDANEEWSNTYAFSGATPADSTAWRALYDALVVEERKLYSSVVYNVGGYGYDKIPAKGDHAIWTVDLTVAPNSPLAGTGTPTGNSMPGDAAAWVRWGLDRFSSPGGKRIYLRKYFHGVYQDAGNKDQISSTQNTAYLAFAAKMRDGSFSGSRTLVDKFGNVPIGAAVSPYITTRTLKRRGKRPGS